MSVSAVKSILWTAKKSKNHISRFHRDAVPVSIISFTCSLLLLTVAVHKAINVKDWMVAQVAPKPKCIIQCYRGLGM